MTTAMLSQARVVRFGVTIATLLFFLGRFMEYESVDFHVQTAPVMRRFDNWTFEWEDLDTTTSGICGGFKCFFLSRAYPHSLGYLFVPKKAAMSFKTGEAAKEFAESLQQQFPSMKVLIPWNVELKYASEANIEKLNSNLYLLKTGDISNSNHYVEGNVTVYTVPTAPTPHYQLKSRLYGNKVAKLVKKYMEETNPNLDLDLWLENLQSSVDLIEEMLPVEPCMAKDFQVLLEISTGHLWHFDLDRCFDGHENKKHGTATATKRVAFVQNAIPKHIKTVKAWPSSMQGAFKKIQIL